MVLGRLHLALEIAFGGRGIPLLRVISFLITIVIAGHNGNTLGTLRLPLLFTIGTFPNALGGDLRWCHLANTGGCFHVAQDGGGPDRLLTRGVLSGDVEWLIGSFQLFMAKLVHQGVARHAIPEHQHDIDISHTRELMALS
jgi:hypothetical protein